MKNQKMNENKIQNKEGCGFKVWQSQATYLKNSGKILKFQKFLVNFIKKNKARDEKFSWKIIFPF